MRRLPGLPLVALDDAGLDPHRARDDALEGLGVGLPRPSAQRSLRSREPSALRAFGFDQLEIVAAGDARRA